jgi:hypothetical protein
MFKGLFMAALVWLLMPREPDIGFGPPIVSGEFQQLDGLRAAIFKGLDRVSADLSAQRKR